MCFSNVRHLNALMKTKVSDSARFPLLQVHLIEGIIDQVEGTVYVSWVQPRVLGVPQIKSLRGRLDSWVNKVNETLNSVEAETPDLVAA